MEEKMGFADYDDENNAPPKKPPGVTGGCGAGLGGAAADEAPSAPQSLGWENMPDEHPHAG